MSFLKNMFGGGAQKRAAKRSEAMQRESLQEQKAAQNKQLEVKQAEEAQAAQQMGEARRQRRGARLLMAAETGFGGVQSKLGG